MQKYNGKMYSFFYSQFEEMKLIKLYGLAKMRLNALAALLKEIRSESFKNRLYHYILHLSGHFSHIVILALLVYVFTEIQKGEMTIGFYLLFVNCAILLIMPVSQIVNLGTLVQQGRIAASRVSEVTGAFEEVSKYENCHKLLHLRHLIMQL